VNLHHWGWMVAALCCFAASVVFQKIGKRLGSQPSITCPRCGMISYHPQDIEQRYCVKCHLFHDSFFRQDRAAG
jgi:ribosomal protein L37E